LTYSSTCRIAAFDQAGNPNTQFELVLLSSELSTVNKALPVHSAGVSSVLLWWPPRCGSLDNTRCLAIWFSSSSGLTDNTPVDYIEADERGERSYLSRPLEVGIEYPDRNLAPESYTAPISQKPKHPPSPLFSRSVKLKTQENTQI